MTGRPAGEWLDVAGASSRLNVSPEALRKRIRRGTVTSEKRDGRWFVQVDNDQDAAWTQHDSVQDAVQDNGRDALVEQLRADVDFLRAELEARRDELRRRDVLVAQQQDSISELAGRLQALSSGSAFTQAPQAGDTTSNSPDPHEGSDRAWWAFWRS